jgi:hypothetical protein
MPRHSKTITASVRRPRNETRDSLSVNSKKPAEKVLMETFHGSRRPNVAIQKRKARTQKSRPGTQKGENTMCRCESKLKRRRRKRVAAKRRVDNFDLKIPNLTCT